MDSYHESTPLEIEALFEPDGLLHIEELVLAHRKELTCPPSFRYEPPNPFDYLASLHVQWYYRRLEKRRSVGYWSKK